MIPVSSPLFAGNEAKYLAQAIKAGEVSSAGRYVRRFEQRFCRWVKARYAVAVNSGTAALETAVWAIGAKYVCLPSGTIISCALACIRAGAKYYFRDNDTAERHEEIMRVHLFGKEDRSTGKVIIDDCSQYWRPREHPGVSVYSLYANKLITSGEGGILVTNERWIYDRAISYRNLCHSQERFYHYALGYNFRMSNLQAAVALAQLEQVGRFLKIKRQNARIYRRHLPDVEILFDTRQPWMYLIATEHDAGAVIKKMLKKGIECRRFFYPLHKQPCLQYTGKKTAFPRANILGKHAFYLPSGLCLTERQIRKVCRTLSATLKSMTGLTERSHIVLK